MPEDFHQKVFLEDVNCHNVLPEHSNLPEAKDIVKGINEVTRWFRWGPTICMLLCESRQHALQGCC